MKGVGEKENKKNTHRPPPGKYRNQGGVLENFNGGRWDTAKGGGTRKLVKTIRKDLQTSSSAWTESGNWEKGERPGTGCV